MQPSERLQRIPPYLFAELERKIAAKRAAGIDVISLGIGDPDRPTPPLIVEAMEEAVADPGTHRYPSNRGRVEFREAVRDFYARRFEVDGIDPDVEVMAAIGAKECIFNLNLAFLDHGDVALAADPGYPVYTAGPLLGGGAAVRLPLVPEPGFVPDLDAIAAYWRLKSNVDSGNFEAVQLAGVAALSPDADAEVASMNELYRRRRDLVVGALRRIGVDVTPPRATIYIWAPVPEGFDSSAAYCEHVLDAAAVVVSPGGAYGPSGEGYFRISLTTPDERLLEAVERLGSLAA